MPWQASQVGKRSIVSFGCRRLWVAITWYQFLGSMTLQARTLRYTGLGSVSLVPLLLARQLTTVPHLQQAQATLFPSEHGIGALSWWVQVHPLFTSSYTTQRQINYCGVIVSRPISQHREQQAIYQS